MSSAPGTPPEGGATAPGRRLDAAARIMLRPLGSPLALGFLGLSGGTVVLSGLQLGWIEPAESRQVGLILLAFPVPLQLLASVFGFLSRDTLAGTGMGVLAGTWLAVALVKLGSPPEAVSDALGLLLLLSALALLAPAASSLVAKVVPAAVMTLAAVRFGLSGIAQLSGSGAWEDAAGVAGLVLVAAALYAAFGLEIEDTRRQHVLPLGRRGFGRSAIEGDLEEQLARIHNEAGVREQL